jgi:hypothetical protein
MGMKNLDRDAANRSIDYRAEMERQKDAEFSTWDNIKFGIGIPLLFIALVASVIGLVVSLWGSLR